MFSKEHAAQAITRAEVGNRKVVVEIGGNNRYIIVTEDMVLVGSKGISSGSFFGSKVKRYPIDSITSVDVRKSTFVIEFEIGLSGGSDIGSTNAGFSSRAHNENVTMFNKEHYNDVQTLAATILDLRQRRKEKDSQPSISNHSPRPSIPEQIKQLADLRDAGILTNEEFDEKKQELLKRI